MTVVRWVLAVSLLSSICAVKVVDLTEANFEMMAVHSNKHVFVKFFTPSCKYCRSMEKAWFELGTAYEGSKKILIAQVNCAEEPKVCGPDMENIRSYPTMKWFTWESGAKGHLHSGGRSFQEFDDYVKREFMDISTCDPKTLDQCDDKERQFISEMKGKGEMESELKRLLKLWTYGTPYVKNPNIVECKVITDPGCHPAATTPIEDPIQGGPCCEKLGEACSGYLYVSASAQAARDGNEIAGIHFCSPGSFQTGTPDAKSASGYTRPDTQDPETVPENATWLSNRILILRRLTGKRPSPAAQHSSGSAQIVSGGDLEDLPDDVKEQIKKEREAQEARRPTKEEL